MPLRDPPVEAGQDMARRPPSSQKIGRLLQHPPSPLSTRSRNRVRYKVGCLRVPMRDVCGEMRGAGGAGGAPVASGLVRRRGLRVCRPAVSARRCAGQSYSSMLDLLSDRHMPFPGQTRT